MKTLCIAIIAVFACILAIPPTPVPAASSAERRPVTPPTNPTQPAQQPGIPGQHYYQTIPSTGVIQYGLYTPIEATARMTEMKKEYEDSKKLYTQQKQEWETAFPGKPFPMLQVAEPKMTQLSLSVPVGDYDRRLKLKRMNEMSPKSWTVIETMDGGFTTCVAQPDDQVVPYENRILDKYRLAALEQKQAAAQNPTTAAKELECPTFKIIQKSMEIKAAQTLLAARLKELQKTAPKTTQPAAATTPGTGSFGLPTPPGGAGQSRK